MFKQPFKKHLSSSGGLQQIQKNLNAQRKLLDIVKSGLPENLAEHCLHVTTKAGKITLFTDSSVWASKLLYLRKPILDSLSLSCSTPIKSLKIKVLSKQASKSQAQLKPVSSSALTFLAQANEVDANDPLKVAMNKLITTLQKNNASS